MTSYRAALACAACLLGLAWAVAASAQGPDAYPTRPVTIVAPYAAGGDWVVDRITTLLPLCNYFSPVGSYSLRSYSLDPEKKTERVTLCRGGTPVPPFAGSCPPK